MLRQSDGIVVIPYPDLGLCHVVGSDGLMCGLPASAWFISVSYLTLGEVGIPNPHGCCVHHKPHLSVFWMTREEAVVRDVMDI